MGQRKGVVRHPLWEARRNYGYMSTMLDRRKVKYSERLAADQWKLDELARQIAELENAEK